MQLIQCKTRWYLSSIPVIKFHSLESSKKWLKRNTMTNMRNRLPAPRSSCFLFSSESFQEELPEKQLFLKISQYSLRPATLLKRDSNTGVFCEYNICERLDPSFMILLMTVAWLGKNFDKEFFLRELLKQQTNRNHPKPAATNLNHPKPPRNYPKPSETTWNYLQPTQNFPKLGITSPAPLDPPPTHRATKPLILTLFFCFRVWTWMNSLEKKTRKSWQKP